MEGGNLAEVGNKDFSDRLNQHRVNPPTHDPAIHRNASDNICEALLLAIHVPRKPNVLEAGSWNQMTSIKNHTH